MNLATTTRQFLEIPIGLIDAPVLPSRTAMDEEKLDALAQSLREIGLQQPIIVYRKAERFGVIAGHRRTLAAQRAHLVVVPAIVYPTHDDALDAIQFAENHFREDLSVTDEAIWFQELLEQKCGGDIEQLAARVGKKIGYIDGRLMLFRGDPKVFAALAESKISIGVAHELNTIPEAKWVAYYLDSAIRCGATVTVVRAWVMEWRQLFGPQVLRPPVPAESTVGAPGSTMDANACILCGRSDHAYAIRHLPMHTHCYMTHIEPNVPKVGASE